MERLQFILQEAFHEGLSHHYYFNPLIAVFFRSPNSYQKSSKFQINVKKKTTTHVQVDMAREEEEVEGGAVFVGGGRGGGGGGKEIEI